MVASLPVRRESDLWIVAVVNADRRVRIRPRGEDRVELLVPRDQLQLRVSTGFVEADETIRPQRTRLKVYGRRC